MLLSNIYFESHKHLFCGANLRKLRECFGKHSFINRTEAEHLAKKLNVLPEQVKRWFERQRKIGTCTCTCVTYRMLKKRVV